MTVDLTVPSVPLKGKGKNQQRDSSNATQSSEHGSPQTDLESSDSPESEESEAESIYNQHTPSASPPPTSPPLRDGVVENRVQILDLHTANPIISFRNQLYNCSWASNLGTELLFTAARPENDLPALVSRPGYSVLAASSFRLVSRPAQLVLREEAQNDQESDASPSTEEGADDLEAKIYVGLGAFPARRRQGEFLEDLMTLKRHMDEEDDVTVYTKPWRPSKRRKSSKVKRLQAVDENASQEGDSGESESELAETQEPEVAVSELVGRGRSTVRKGRSRGRGGRPRTRPSIRGRETVARRSAGFLERPSERTESDAVSLETSTPDSWDELRDSPSVREAEDDSPGSAEA